MPVVAALPSLFEPIMNRKFEHCAWQTTLQGTVGTLEAGKEFDALLIDGRCGAAYDVFPSVTPDPLQEVC